MVEALEDYSLFFEAEERMTNAGKAFLPEGDVMDELGISEAAIRNVEEE